MREIKFRAWYGVIGLWLNDVWFVTRPSGDAFEMVYQGPLIDSDAVKDKVTIEQYTGLKDFNGIEIYEGDILQDIDDSTIVGAVEYDEAYGEYSCGGDSLYEATRCCVVIGNIHENTDLLEED